MDTTAKELAQAALKNIDAALASGEIDETIASIRRRAVMLVLSVAD